jgi:hypothetical protein
MVLTGRTRLACGRALPRIARIPIRYEAPRTSDAFSGSASAEL